MPLREIIRLSFEALFAHRFRTMLTMLGITVGVSSIVLLVSIGSGAKNYVLQEFEGLGTNIIIIQPGRTDKKSSFGPPIGVSQRKMTLWDVAALEKRALSIEAVTGLVFGTVTAKVDEFTNDVSVFGSNDNFNKILNIPLAQGAFFTREEDDYGRRVVVLGANIAINLFGNDSPLGRSVKLNQSEFRVIGVTKPTGDKLGFNLDDFVFIPTRTALRLFNEEKLFGIRAKSRSRASIDDAVAEITEILKERRDGEEDFTVVTQVAMMESMATILNMLTYVLGGIAGISMLVAGIGIMNIMLVSVTERTAEIGIRRAVGARRRDVMWQFLAEAVALATLGGISGLAISLLITHGGYAFFPNFDLRAPLWILGPAFGTSLLIGGIFGILPARRAARVEPLEALRTGG